jgi:hypothetical protein
MLSGPGGNTHVKVMPRALVVALRFS